MCTDVARGEVENASASTKFQSFNRNSAGQYCKQNLEAFVRGLNASYVRACLVDGKDIESSLYDC